MWPWAGSREALSGVGECGDTVRELKRSGLAGTISVYKAAAALSDQGANLDEVEKVAKYVTTRLGTIGIGLEHCHVIVFHPFPLCVKPLTCLGPGNR